MRTRSMQAPLSAALLASLTGCTHFGTHIAGHFRCRTPDASCQPVSVVDAAATRELLGVGEPARTQPKLAMSNKTTRTGERTLKVVFPAHVDETGVLHEDSVVWTVVEPARWASELPGADKPAKGLRPLKDALRRIEPKGDTSTDPSIVSSSSPPSSDDTALIDLPFHSDASPVLPSRGGVADAGESTRSGAGPAAEGSDMPASPQVRTPRPFDLTWPSAAAIDAARAKAKPSTPGGAKQP